MDSGERRSLRKQRWKKSMAAKTEPTKEGAAVLKEVVQMTGLPETYLDSEISQFLGTATESVNDLTLDQLRSVLLNYLETENEEMTQTEAERH
jgi:hypothetical protein